MGSMMATQVDRWNTLEIQNKTLTDLKISGQDFPGCRYQLLDRKNWMYTLNPENLHIYKIVWPGIHHSATDELGIEVVMEDVKRFLFETKSEIIILEVRTKYGHRDPPGFDEYLVDQLGELLIHQDDNVFEKTIAEVLPWRIICVWKPRTMSHPEAGGALWNAEYLKNDWINTDLPMTKFNSNMKHSWEQPPLVSRRYFYRVENTVTPVPDNPVLHVRPVTERIHHSWVCQALHFFVLLHWMY